MDAPSFIIRLDKLSDELAAAEADLRTWRKSLNGKSSPMLHKAEIKVEAARYAIAEATYSLGLVK